MASLETGYIDLILADFKNRGLNKSLFFEELFDHVCCKVEAHMSNGEDFDIAYGKCSTLIDGKKVSKADKNRNFIVNFRMLFTKWVLFASLILYIASWFLHFGPIDWLEGISILLLSFVLLRYSIILKWDRNTSGNNFYSKLAGFSFVFFICGGLMKFISNNFSFSSHHYAPMLVFGYLLLSLLVVRYYVVLERISGTSSGIYRLIKILGCVHLVFAIVGMSTFFLTPSLRYVPILSGIIIIFDIICFIITLIIKQKGKYIFQGLIIGSFIAFFSYFPFKSMMAPKPYQVQFRLELNKPVKAEKMFLYLNYYKYGKEILPIYKMNDSVFQSHPILFHGGGIDFSYKLTRDSLELNKVLTNNDIAEYGIRLEHNDTVFILKENDNGI